MTSSYSEDMVYLGKIVLLTLIVLSLVVIYNNKLLEGIILMSFCFQLLLFWLLMDKYTLPENFIIYSKIKKFRSPGDLLNSVILFIFFILALIFIFRAIAIIQFSFTTHGLIKPEYYNNIFFAGGIGSVFIIVFVLIVIIKYRKFN